MNFQMMSQQCNKLISTSVKYVQGYTKEVQKETLSYCLDGVQDSVNSQGAHVFFLPNNGTQHLAWSVQRNACWKKSQGLAYAYDD